MVTVGIAVLAAATAWTLASSRHRVSRRGEELNGTVGAGPSQLDDVGWQHRGRLFRLTGATLGLALSVWSVPGVTFSVWPLGDALIGVVAGIALGGALDEFSRPPLDRRGVASVERRTIVTYLARRGIAVSAGVALTGLGQLALWLSYRRRLRLDEPYDEALFDSIALGVLVSLITATVAAAAAQIAAVRPKPDGSHREAARERRRTSIRWLLISGTVATALSASGMGVGVVALASDPTPAIVRATAGALAVLQIVGCIVAVAWLAHTSDTSTSSTPPNVFAL